MRMSKKQVCLIAIAAILVSGGQAMAADIACPEAGAIKQTPDKDKGYVYAASANGLEWEGENPEGKDGDAKTLRFNEVSLVNAKHFVACDYIGDGDAGVRMILMTKKDVVPANPAVWSAAPAAAPTCKESKASLCAFKEGG